MLGMPKETAEQRETRERLGFFKSLPVSEQVRLAQAFHDLVRDGLPGVHGARIEVEATAFRFGPFSFQDQTKK